MVIKTIKYGSGVIRIHDDFSKNKTEEEKQKVVDEVSKLIIGYYTGCTAGGYVLHIYLCLVGGGL